MSGVGWWNIVGVGGRFVFLFIFRGCYFFDLLYEIWIFFESSVKRIFFNIEYGVWGNEELKIILRILVWNIEKIEL